jgi:hypothetical protein
MTGEFGLDHLIILLVAFEIALFATTGALHLLRPAHLRVASAGHVAAGAISPRGASLLSPRRLAAVELLTTLVVLVAALSHARGVLLVSQAVLAVLAVLFIAFLLRLQRARLPLACGCHPLESTVTRASFLPALATLAATATIVALAQTEAATVPRPHSASDAIALCEIVLLGWATAFAVIIRSGASE